MVVLQGFAVQTGCVDDVAEDYAPAHLIVRCVIGLASPRQGDCNRRHGEGERSMGQPAMLQETLARDLNGGSIDRHLRGLHGRFAGLVARDMEAVAKFFPSGTSLVEPSSGFLLWADIDTPALHGRALEIGLGLAPGVMFSASNGSRNAVRINCGIEWSGASEAAYEAYGKLLRSREL